MPNNFNLNDHYTLKQTRDLPEISAVGHVYVHNQSGAKIYHLACEDENKVFCATFKTPPSDDTGVPHILEHCVLNGSQKFDVKDPFFQLAKGSLYTFLNAMTYSDKTLYPVASYNDKDFLNLMEVYLDAVFFPKVHDRKTSFLQEGWSLKAKSKDAPLEYGGVVYSEMKGAYSNPDDKLYTTMSKTLYPDTCYRFSSGGDPEFIPELTYEQFLDFHRKFYAPENGYLYFYGDMDINVCLKKTHEDYLSKFTKTGNKITIDVQKPFSAPVFTEKSYAVVEDEEEAQGGKNYLAAAYVMDRSVPDLDYYVMSYLLMHEESSPLKKALKERGIGERIQGYASPHSIMPDFSIIIQNSEYDAKYLKSQIDEILTELVKTGFDDKFFDACLNYFEFRYREQDFGSYPKGVMILTEEFACEIYGEDPFDNLFWLERIAALRKKGAGYFVEMIEKFLLKNNHSAFVTLVPDDKLNDKTDKALEAKLAALKKTLSDADVSAIIEEGEELLAFQNTPDTEEGLASIPMVEISDLKKEAEHVPLEKDDCVYCTPIDTNGIAYINMWFDTRGIDADKLRNLHILSKLLCALPTKNYTLEELINAILEKTGGLDFSYSEISNSEGYKPFAIAQIRALHKNVPAALDLCSEIIANTLFDDKERIKKRITEIKATYDKNFVSSGHSTAILRATSRISQKEMYAEHVRGVNFFRYIEGLLKNFDSNFEKLVSDLNALAAEVFSKQRLTVSVTLDGSAAKEFSPLVKGFIGKLSDKPYTPSYLALTPCDSNEGFITASQVQYNVVAGNFIDKGFKYDARAEVMRKILNDEFLLDRIRVKGGAYGFGAAINRNGTMYMMSYRDPKLRETYDVYSQAADWIASFAPDNREMTRYILGTTNNFDVPKTARQKGLQAISDHFGGITHKMRQEERAAILSVTPAQINEFAALLRECVADGIKCTVGSEASINACKDMFGKVEKL